MKKLTISFISVLLLIAGCVNEPQCDDEPSLFNPQCGVDFNIFMCQHYFQTSCYTGWCFNIKQTIDEKGYKIGFCAKCGCSDCCDLQLTNSGLSFCGWGECCEKCVCNEKE